MIDKRMIEELANLEGKTVGLDVWYQDSSWWTAIEGNVGRLRLSNYLEDHNAVQRVIDGLDEEGTFRYVRRLRELMGDLTAYCFIIKATPRQKCEAILKAKGLWEGK